MELKTKILKWSAGVPVAMLNLKTAEKLGVHSINAGTFCEALIEGADGYMDRKAEAEGTNLGTATLTFNAEQHKINGHI